MTNNDPERLLRLSRWALGVLLALLFVFWQCVAPPTTTKTDVYSSPPPLTVLPTATVYVFASATPTAQAAEKLPTLAGTRTPTPTFTPMPTRTAAPTGTRVPTQRGAVDRPTLLHAAIESAGHRVG